MFGGAESFEPRATLRTHMGAALTTLADTTIEHRRTSTGDVALHYVEAGPLGPRRAASPVILLHGFPEFWYAWRHQIPALARAGLRVIAPDMRPTSRAIASRRSSTTSPRSFAGSEPSARA